MLPPPPNAATPVNFYTSPPLTQVWGFELTLKCKKYHNLHSHPLKVKLQRIKLLPDSHGPKERQFEAKRQSQKIDLIKRFILPAASQDAKSKLQAEVASYKLNSWNLMLWIMTSFYIGGKGPLPMPSTIAKQDSSHTSYSSSLFRDREGLEYIRTDTEP